MAVIQKQVPSGENKIYIDVDNMIEATFQMVDIMSFISGVYYSALLENHIVTIRDEEFLSRELFTLVNQIVDEVPTNESHKQILRQRIFSYGRACINNTVCGMSMYGFLKLDFSAIEEWCKDSPIKCTFLLCDYIMYKQKLNKIVPINDLINLKPISSKNSPMDIKYLRDIFSVANPISNTIFNKVSKLSEDYKWKKGPQMNLL